jgi:diguanylate cyclase (GGDEF)-like protein
MAEEHARMNEVERLRILDQYGILDTPLEEPFERISALARLIFDTPIVLISLVDDRRQWFKTNIGIDIRETPREQAFCNETIRSDDVLVISDAEHDIRTALNPLVTGSPHIRFYAGAPLITPEKARLGSLCVIDRAPRRFDERQKAILQSLAGLVMKEMELRRQTDHDWLTGARSRSAFYGTWERLAARMTPPSIGLISFDIDHFKQINDRFGHMAGDRVLIDVVEVCRGVLRDGDVISRMGGEEFAVLLPGATAKSALAVAERLRQAIESSRRPEGDGTVTASFGVTMLDQSDIGLADPLRRADEALYQSKANGRNRVTCSWAMPAEIGPGVGSVRNGSLSR